MVTITDFNLPVTSITWQLGDMVLTSATENVTITSSGDFTQPPATSTLVVDPVLSLVSQGMYTVTVTNPAGTAVTGYDVTVLGTHGQLSVSVLPDALFVDSGGVHDIVETAFIRLVCTASSGSAPDVEWQRNSVAVTSDVPSRWIRTSISGSTTSSVLNIASFQSTDDGTYRCVATDGGSPMNSDTVTLTAVSSTPDGTVTVVTFPEDTDTIFNFDNRVPVDLTETFTSECVGGHMGESSGSNTGLPAPPNVVWVRDGVALADGGRITIVNSDQHGTPPSRKRSVLTITNFVQSDAGIYQCIFTDVDPAGEVIATIPLEVDTGATLSVQRISPTNIVLVPPEKLVLEVETSGAYAVIEWTKNAIPAGDPANFPATLDNFVNFFEIFVREPTTTSDIGLYGIDLGVGPGQSEPQPVQISVTPYMSPATTATGSSPVTVMEGQDVDISCTSSGNPIPDITWELDGSSTPFDQSDSSNPLQISLDEATGDFQFTVGQRMSTLQIRSAVYPDHDGVYTCTGANSQATESGSDSATITVVVQAIPEVEVVAPQTRVAPGGSVTLTCNVTKANPAVSTFSWTFTPSGGSIMTLSGETSSTLTLTDFATDDVGEYTCTATNSVGTGSDSIIIEEGVPPEVTVAPLDPVVLGITVSLTCSATGDPPITYEWRMQGDSTVLNSNTATGDFDLTLADFSDYGTYTCTARNNFGTDSGSVVVEQALPPVTPANQTVDVIVGDSLTLMVTITDFNLPITSITWRLGDMELTSAIENVTVTSSGDLTQPPATSTLVVDPVLSLVSQGTYTVTVTNIAGTAVTGFDVTVLAPATIRDPPGPTSVTEDEGQPVAFSCTASGSPASSIQWFRGSSLLMDMDMMNRVTISDSLFELPDFFYRTSNLIIDPVERADADEYQCVAAVNDVGVNTPDQEDFTLTVNFAPDITSTLVDVNAEYLETVTLSCTAVGLPEPTFAWFIQPYGDAQTQLSDDGVNILISTAADPLGVFTVTSNLTLVSVEPSDTANYTCIATNNLNTATDTAAVTVLAGAEITFPLGAPSAEVNRTESINLTCTARGSPAPVFMWYYEDTLLMESSEGISLTTLPTSGMSSDFISVTSILMVESTEPEDGGTYTCVASNTVYGREVNDSQVYTLQVNFPITITDSPISVDVLSPQPAVLNCTTRGVPIPDFVWIKEFINGTTVVFTESTGNIDISCFYSGAVTVSTLTIDPTGPSDTALYTCFAENLLIRGSPEESDTAQVRVFERPDPPQNITVVEFRARWVLLEWMAGFDGNRPIQRFLIYENNLNTSAGFTLAGDENLGEVQVPMEENTFRFNVSMNISPFSNYIFTVRVCNGLGCSDLEDGPTSDQIRTEEDAPEQPPENIIAFSPSSTSIRVSWDPPPDESHNGIITGYRIDYTATLIPTTRCDNPEPMPPAGEETTTDTTFTLNNLAIYASYSIMVSARTRAGFGPPSQPPVRVLTLNDTSSAPTNVMVDTVEMTELTLSWSCPETPNGMITQYMVYYQGMKDYVAEDFVSELLTTTTMGDELTITLTQLFPDTIYTISVSALSPAGEGERSVEVTGRTLTAPPPSLAPPMVPEEQTGGPSTVTICFTRPTTTNGRISHYHAVAIRLSSSTDSLSHPDTDYNSFQSLQQNSYSDINCGSTPSGPQAYIAAEFADSLFGDGCFTFGDDERGDRDFTNGPLCFSSPYRFFLRAYTQAQSSNKKRAVGLRQIDRQYDLFSSTDYTPVQNTATPPMLFQLQLMGILNCLEWVNENTEEKLEDVAAAVAQETNELCQCGFTEQNITDSGFQCFSDTTEVTFRARLHGTASASSSELVSYIEQLVESGISILVQGVRLAVDANCQPIVITSFGDPECIAAQSSQSDNTGAIVGGVVAGVAVVSISLLILVIAVTYLVLKNRRAELALHKRTLTEKEQLELTHISRASAAQRPSAPHVSPDADYELVAELNPAYHTVLQSRNRQQEISTPDEGVYETIPGDTDP